MKKTLFKIAYFLIGAAICLTFACFCISFLSGGVASGNTINACAAGEAPPYIYGNITLLADVNEDKTVDITERFRVSFTERQNYLTRKMQRETSLTRLVNGKKVKGKKFIASVSNAKATVDGKEARVALSDNGSHSYLTVFNPQNENFNLEHTAGADKITSYLFEINYRIDFSDDTLKSFDDLTFRFFNQSQYRFYTDSKLYLRVTMPKQFERDRVSIFTYDYKPWEKSEELGEEFHIIDNQVYATVAMQRARSFNFQILLEKGYFNTKLTYFWYYWLFFGIAAALIFASAIIAFIFRPRKPVTTVELTPPELNPLHFSAFWHGYARKRDICTVILQWASAGCVRIARNGKRDIILTKLKDLPDGRTDAEVKYFKTLFSRGKVYSSKAMRLKSNQSFYYTVKVAANGLLDEAKSPVTYAKGVIGARIATAFIAAAAFVVAMMYFAVIAGNPDTVIFGTILLGMLLVPCWQIKYLYGERARQLLRKRDFGFMVFMLAMLLSFAVFGVLGLRALFAVYMGVYDYINMVLIALVWLLIAALILPKFIAKRNEQSQMFYGRMLGFKRFLITCELPRIEMLVEENPEYYYDILPYCMIMGLSGKVDKKFKYLNTAVPGWADGFDCDDFVTSLFGLLKKNVKTRKKFKSEER